MAADATLGKLTASRSRPTAQKNSPHTPFSRPLSGLYGSPGSSFRIDDENLLIFEFGTRHLSAGFAGEFAPRCNVIYTPELWRRVGDYRQWDLGYEKSRRHLDASGRHGFELWNLDVRHADLGLIEDRIEKLVREAEAKWLLLDNRGKRVSLVAPSGLPRPLLNLVVRRLFGGLHAASVVVLSSSIMAAAGAGARSALVVDLGWFESTVSAVYDYREVHQSVTLRAGKMLQQHVSKLLQTKLNIALPSSKRRVSFEEAEEVMRRVIWCRQKATKSRSSESDSGPELDNMLENNATVTIPIDMLGAAGDPGLSLTFQELSQPAEATFFASTFKTACVEIEELSIHEVIYEALLQLPADIRSICMSNIIFVGGISNIPGLKGRILSELKTLVDAKQWDHVREYGNKLESAKKRVPLVPLGHSGGNARPLVALPRKVTESTTWPAVSEPDLPTTPAHARAHDTNPIDSKLASVSLRDAAPATRKGEIRAIESVGAWAGASLLTNLRVKGVVEIERERFMSHGLVGGAYSGSNKAAPANQEAQPRTRQSLAANVKLGAEKSTGWSLGVWG